MKKIIILAACALSLQLHAQQSGPTIAPEAGLTLARLQAPGGFDESFHPDYKRKPGFRLGAVLTFPLKNGFFIQTGAFISQKNFNTVIQVAETFDTSGKPLKVSDVSYASSHLYLVLPVSLGYERSFGKAGSAFLTAGGYFGYALQGSFTNREYRDGILNSGYGYSITYRWKSPGPSPGDAGLCFSGGYKLPFGLYGRLQYERSLNMFPNGIRTNVWSLSFGYTFPLKKTAAIKPATTATDVDL